VDDGVSGRKDQSIFIRKAKSVSADIAGDRGNSARAHVIKRLVRGGVLFPQAIEGIVGKDFSCCSASGSSAAAVANEKDEFAIRDAAEETFDKSGTYKAR
jgi:hypothetical protein